jgi:hypothetical protein
MKRGRGQGGHTAIYLDTGEDWRYAITIKSDDFSLFIFFEVGG